jgi:predicted acetyltransferase
MEKIDYTYTPVKKKELDEIIKIVSDALLVPPTEYKKVRQWLETEGIDSMRAVRDVDTLVGGVQMVPWGHFYGGKSVPAVGISFVGVRPEYRRMGAASFMMNECVREIYREGYAVSTLYPANIPLYRRSGYEVAHRSQVYELNPSKILVRSHDCKMERVDKSSLDILKDIYRKFASATNGNIDRNESFWTWIFEPIWDKHRDVYIISYEGKPEGYAVVTVRDIDKPLKLRDYAATTHRAALRLITFLADHSSLVKKIKFIAGPGDPVIDCSPEWMLDVKDICNVMLRIVNVSSALEQRGYQKFLDGEVHFEIEDDIVPENNGNWILSVKKGRGRCKQGGKGSIEIDIRQLAQLYSCYFYGTDFLVNSSIKATKKDIEHASVIFSGPSPWMRDDF